MAALTSSSHERTGTRGPDTQTPDVVNVRRPLAARSNMAPAEANPQRDLRRIDDAPQPQTALRLPDLAAIAQRVPSQQINLGSIAVWVAIGLGGLLALWLIFGGGRPPAREVNEAPPWAPAKSSSAEAAAAASNGPDAAGSQAPAWPPSDSPAPFAPVHADPNPSDPPPSQYEPTATELPDWNDPDWNNSARRAAPPGNAPQQAVRTAHRADEHRSRAPGGPQPGEAQPLDIMVPVVQ